MTWLRGSQQTQLNKLNNLTSRLIYLVTYKKLKECQQRLQDKNIECNLLDNFKAITPNKEETSKIPYLVKVIPSKESTF